MPIAPLPPYLARPRLRLVDVVAVRDSEGRSVLVLRDGEGVATRDMPLPGPLGLLATSMDGRRSVVDSARHATAQVGLPVEEAWVVELARRLDAAGFLDSPTFVARRRAQVEAFGRLEVRPAHHAGGAYPGDAAELEGYIVRQCLGRAEVPPVGGRVAGLCAPHMDLWRASRGYGHAYAALAQGIAPELETVIVLGTCHAGMRQPFAVCDKAFDTPLGAVPVDGPLVDWLARQSRFDVREDAYMHKVEHSIEFQVVFLKHLLRDRPVRILPVLCGLGEAQGRGSDPRADPRAESFLGALAEIVTEAGRRVLVVAGADLAHVGPRFGDPAPLDEEGRKQLSSRDEASVALALAQDAQGFFAHTVEDLHRRRVCGVGPIYTLLRALGGQARGERLSYEQCVDPEEGSIVTHASLAFIAA